jgi:DNA-binding CsgD family transcriptional regulator
MAEHGSDPLPRLSERQQQCLLGVLEFKSAKQIARDLGVSQHAVEKHLKAVRDKFGVDSTAEAARLYAMAQSGKDIPYYGATDLAPSSSDGHADRVPDMSDGLLQDETGALLLDAQLTPRQTLLMISAVCFASIVGLLLLVACAEGVRALVTS